MEIKVSNTTENFYELFQEMQLTENNFKMHQWCNLSDFTRTSQTIVVDDIS